MNRAETPVLRDINVNDSLDEIRAAKNFLRKNVTEAEMMLRDNSDRYLGDFLWMGAKAFNYYLDSIHKYILSDHSAEDATFLYGLLSVFEFRLNYDGSNVDREKMRRVVTDIIANFDKFKADSELYGNLKGGFERLASRLAP
jgi:hypothetical protein